MIGIVFEHSSINVSYTDIISTLVSMIFLLAFKFVTIVFFMIAGFLLHHKFREYSSIQYLKNRISNTFKPWSFWVAILIVLNILYLVYSIGLNAVFKSFDTFTIILFSEIYNTVFLTSFWFIPNFLLCICILLSFKKVLYSCWLGFFFLILTLFYCVNIYTGWVLASHSGALLGFVFYFWLGAYINKHYSRISSHIKKCSYTRLIIINVFLFITSLAESYFLFTTGSDQVFNVLKFTNILYSLGMFVLLIKIGKINWLSVNLLPRKTTFGIYLVHWIFVVYLTGLVFKPFHLVFDEYNVYQNIGWSILRFLTVYLSSFFIVKMLISSKFKWVFGIRI